MSWTKTYEVCFSILNEDGTCDSGNAYLTTQVQAFMNQRAEAQIRGAYGRNCQIHSCIQVD